MRRAKRVATVVVGLLALAVALAVLNLSTIVLWTMTPSGPFDPTTAPLPPDYSEPQSWSALPERDDAADVVPAGLLGVDQRSAPVDVFYVHPTTYLGSRWNAPVDDAELNRTTDDVATQIQATAFNGCCAVYAPRFRQTNGLPFIAPSQDGERAVDLAYADIVRAFDAFNARRGPARPFILAGHSQGTILAERLLYERISQTPLRDELVAAYLIGGAVTVAGLRTHAPDIEPCSTPSQARCVVAWNARGEDYVPGRWEIPPKEPGERLCTNPLSWRLGGERVAAGANTGAVFIETDDRSPRPGFADAQCVGGTLVIRSLREVPRGITSRILDRVLGAGNFHPIEYQIFFSNLRDNAALRAAAHRSRRQPGYSGANREGRESAELQ